MLEVVTRVIMLVGQWLFDAYSVVILPQIQAWLIAQCPSIAELAEELVTWLHKGTTLC